MFSFKLYWYGNILKVIFSGKIPLPFGAVVMFKVLESLFFFFLSNLVFCIFFFNFVYTFRPVLLCFPFSSQPSLLFLTSGLAGFQFLFVLGEKKNHFSFPALAQLVCCLPVFRNELLHYYFICWIGNYCNYNCCLYWVPLFHWQELRCIIQRWNIHPQLTVSIYWIVVFFTGEKTHSDHNTFLYFLHDCYFIRWNTNICFQTISTSSMSYFTSNSIQKGLNMKVNINGRNV